MSIEEHALGLELIDAPNQQHPQKHVLEGSQKVPSTGRFSQGHK